MKLLQNGGFLRESNGLNSLDSIKQLAKILNISEFKFQVKGDLITNICRNSKTGFNLILCKLSSDNPHRPIVILVNQFGGQHATVLQSGSYFNAVSKFKLAYEINK